MLWWFEVIGVILVIAASLYAFYALAEDVNTSEVVARFDASVASRLARWRRPWLDVVMKVITYAGGTIGVSALTFILVFALIDRGRIADARFSALLVIGGTILANGLKPWLKRVRPTDADAIISQPRSSSFPSGHSMASMCLALAALLVVVSSVTLTIGVKALVIVGCLLYAFLVGISRVYLGVHWPSDVLAAWLLGTAWIAGATGLRLLIWHGLIQSDVSRFTR